MKKYRTIDARELRELLATDERPVLVNALAREAFEDERIPGSVNIPASDALRVAPDLLARDQPIAVYCSSRGCTASPTLAQKLVDIGYTEVMDFEGGIEAWERAGYAIQRSRVAAAV